MGMGWGEVGTKIHESHHRVVWVTLPGSRPLRLFFFFPLLMIFLHCDVVMIEKENLKWNKIFFFIFIAFGAFFYHEFMKFFFPFCWEKSSMFSGCPSFGFIFEYCHVLCDIMVLWKKGNTRKIVKSWKLFFPFFRAIKSFYFSLFFQQIFQLSVNVLWWHFPSSWMSYIFLHCFSIITKQTERRRRWN